MLLDMTFSLVWPTWRKDDRQAPGEALPEGIHVWDLDLAHPDRSEAFWVGANGKLYHPSNHASAKRMVPGVHWLYLHRKGPTELAGSTLATVARRSNRGRYATRVELSDAVEEPVIVLRNPFFQAAVELTSRSHWSEAPSSEGLDGTLRWVYMSTYQAGYTPDLVLRGRDLGFRVVIQHDAAEQAEAAIRRWLRGDFLIAGLSGADADALVATVTFAETSGATHGDPWGEDNKWTTRGTDASSSDEVQVVYPANATSAQLARARALAWERGYHDVTFRAGDPEAGWFHGAVTERDLDESARALAERLGRGRRRTRVYIEGGNMLSGTQASGWPYALVGWDSLAVSMLHMLAEGQLTEHDLELTFAHMKRTGPTDHANVLRDLIRIGFFTPDDPTGMGFQASRAITDAAERERAAWVVLALLETTRIKMMADVRVSPSNFAVIDQLDFHNDMHMRPVGPSTILINDLDEGLALVDRVLAAGPPALERATLADMRTWLAAEAPRYRALTQLVHDQCRAIGLRVVRCPGVFRTQSTQPHPDASGHPTFYRWANFMNAVPGTIPAGSPALLPAGTTFYMTNASGLSSLQAAFEAWLLDPARALGVQRVFFLGGAVAAPATATRPAITWSENSLDWSGGLDCRESHHAGRRAAIDPVVLDPASDRPPTAMA